jgi:hypothetical protein
MHTILYQNGNQKLECVDAMEKARVTSQLVKHSIEFQCLNLDIFIFSKDYNLIVRNLK